MDDPVSMVDISGLLPDPLYGVPEVAGSIFLNPGATMSDRIIEGVFPGIAYMNFVKKNSSWAR